MNTIEQPELLRASIMEAMSQRPSGRGGTISSLNVAIEAMNLAKEHYTSQGHFWHRQRPSRDDQGMLHPHP